jgi:hypothetical protein
MATFEVTPAFKRALKKKPPEMQAKIRECIETLVRDPRSPGLQVHKVQGTPGVWEAYVDRGNRITFERVGQGDIVLLNHCNHDMLRQY